MGVHWYPATEFVPCNEFLCESVVIRRDSMVELASISLKPCLGLPAANTLITHVNQKDAQYSLYT